MSTVLLLAFYAWLTFMMLCVHIAQFLGSVCRLAVSRLLVQ
jgi:hypothetical protein